MHRRARSQSGAAAVEFAILAPLVFAIIFGTLTGAWMWNSKQTLTHGSREAARLGATLVAPLGEDEAAWDTWLDAVYQEALNSSMGELNDGQPGRGVCVAYVGATSHRRALQPAASTPSNAHSLDADNPVTCYDDGRGTGSYENARVQVHIRRDVKFIAVFWVRDIPIQSMATARHEVTKAPTP